MFPCVKHKLVNGLTTGKTRSASVSQVPISDVGSKCRRRGEFRIRADYARTDTMTQFGDQFPPTLSVQWFSFCCFSNLPVNFKEQSHGFKSWNSRLVPEPASGFPGRVRVRARRCRKSRTMGHPTQSARKESETTGQSVANDDAQWPPCVHQKDQSLQVEGEWLWTQISCPLFRLHRRCQRTFCSSLNVLSTKVCPNSTAFNVYWLVSLKRSYVTDRTVASRPVGTLGYK